MAGGLVALVVNLLDLVGFLTKKLLDVSHVGQSLTGGPDAITVVNVGKFSVLNVHLFRVYYLTTSGYGTLKEFVEVVTRSYCLYRIH